MWPHFEGCCLDKGVDCVDSSQKNITVNRGFRKKRIAVTTMCSTGSALLWRSSRRRSIETRKTAYQNGCENIFNISPIRLLSKNWIPAFCWQTYICIDNSVMRCKLTHTLWRLTRNRLNKVMDNPKSEMNHFESSVSRIRSLSQSVEHVAVIVDCFVMFFPWLHITYHETKDSQ